MAKRKHHTKESIMGILKEAEAGMPVTFTENSRAPLGGGQGGRIRLATTQPQQNLSYKHSNFSRD
jgi:hypothetical protein